MFRVTDHLPFLFLIAIPVLLYIDRHSLLQAASWRRLTTLLFRIAAVFCLVLALTGLQFQKESDLLSTVFVLDLSDSIPNGERMRAVDEINRIIERLDENDKYGLVVFGAEAYVKTPLTLVAERAKIDWNVLDLEGIDTTHTNLAKALQLALGVISDLKYQRRIVLFTDGDQNAGNVRDLLDLVRASEIGIFTIPLHSKRKPELIVERLSAPDEVRIEDVFRLRATLRSMSAMEANLRLYRDAQLVESRKVPISPGRQIVDFIQTLKEQPQDDGSFTSIEDMVYEYKLIAEPSEDSIAENNIAYQTVTVKGQSKVLMVGLGEFGDLQVLAGLLEKSQLNVTLIAPHQIPEKSTELNAYDCLILNNVHVDEIGSDGMKMIENYVKDNGRGLIVIGGAQSFGVGNYLDTPLERALPVEMTPRQKKGVLALMLLIDKSGSMANYSAGVQKIQLAIAAAKSAIKTLDEKDQVGVLAFDAKTRAVIELTQAKDKDRLIENVGNIRAGSGTKMYPALDRAYQQLAKVDAKHKLVVILSDGKSKGDFVRLAKKMADDKIAISAIAIGDAAREIMKSIAEAGSGRYFHVADVSQLPKIVTEEIHQTQDLIVENEFSPKIAAQHLMLIGIDSLPKLYGYVATAKKKSAFSLINSDVENQPILAAWNYGLGSSVAFTSNIETNWAADWIEWEKYGKFWRQVIDWVLPATNQNKHFDLHIVNDSGIANVILDGIRPLQRRKIDNRSQVSKFEGRVLMPDKNGIPLEFHRISFDRYEASFDANKRGTYIVTVKTLGKQSSVHTTNLIVPYSPEYSKLEINTPLLRELADISKGEYQPKDQTIVRRPENSIKRFVVLWKWLIFAAISLFVAELITRRLTLSGRLSRLGNYVNLENFEKYQKKETSGLQAKQSEPYEGIPLATRLLRAKEQDHLRIN